MTETSEITYHGAVLMAESKGTSFTLRPASDFSVFGICGMTLIPVDEYNQMEHQNVSLNEDEALVYCTDRTYGESQITINGTTYRFQKELKTLKADPKNMEHFM